MILIGLLLVILAAAVGTLLFVGTQQITDTTDVQILGGTIGLPPLALVVAGAITVALFWLGWALLRGGLRRSARRRAEAKESRRQQDEARLAHERQAQRQPPLS